jgi:peptidyl-prolyl cis-trans isomerase B (cyclophilin B)
MKKGTYINKENNSGVSESYARKRMMTYFQFSLIAIVFVVVFAVIYMISSAKDSSGNIDYSQAELVQYEIPADDTPVVVYETSLGTFKAVLFEEQAPEYCAYFEGLVNSGYYDGTNVFAVQDGVYFMGGSKTSDGTDNDDTDTTECDAEKSKDLWPFYGAMAAYGNQKSMFNSQIQAGSRVLFIGSIEFDDDTVEQLNSASDNTKLNNAFQSKGGVPNFSQQYTIFAQVYDGLDAYADVLSAEVVKPSEDDSDTDADLRPKESLTFDKVYLSTYGENKNDEFFSLDGTESSQAEK